MATVHGVAGSARVYNLDSIQLTNQEKHGKRLDRSSKKRTIYPDAKAVTTTGLDLRELYELHINDPTTPNLLIPETQKGTIALQMLVHFPKDLVDGEDPELMIRHARGFVESIYGEFCVFADRVDRHEEGRHVVDLFLAPKYIKETARKRQWAVSMSKHGKDNAKKWGYQHYNGPVNGAALQDQLHWYLKSVMGLEGVGRGGKKQYAGKDWKSREQHKETELEQRELQLDDREVAVGDLERQKRDLDTMGEEVSREVSKAQANTTEADAAKRRAKADEEAAKMARQQAEADAAAARRALAQVNADLAKLRADQMRLKFDREQLAADRATLTREKSEFESAMLTAQPARDELAADQAALKAAQDQLALDQAEVATLKAERATLKQEKEEFVKVLLGIKPQREQLAAEQAALRAAQGELAKGRAQTELDQKVAAAFERGLVAVEIGEIVGLGIYQGGSKGFSFSQEMMREPASLEALKQAIRPAHDRLWGVMKRMGTRVQERIEEYRDAYTTAQYKAFEAAEQLINANNTLSQVARNEAAKKAQVPLSLAVANEIVNNPLPVKTAEMDARVLLHRLRDQHTR